MREKIHKKPVNWLILLNHPVITYIGMQLSSVITYWLTEIDNI